MISYAEGALELRIEAPLATLILNRPAARNALNLAMWRALPEVAAKIAADPSVRALIVRGAGGNFASGADIAEFPAVFADRASALDYGRLIETATAALAGLDKPVIALIEGYCIGAGLAVALASDLRIAASDAKLGAPPAKLGLMYSLSDTRRLVHAVGPSQAKAMLFTGALHPAAEALRLGLLDEVHAPGALDEAVRAKAQEIAALSAWSIGRAKAVVALVLDGVTQDTEETRGWFADGALGPDFAEGLAAFNAKRRPVFP
jgi:enoyl-CoA hydratase/carnithine racemase